MLTQDDLPTNLAVLVPVAAGVVFCCWQMKRISAVRMDGTKDDGCLDRILLDHRHAQFEGVKHIGGLISAGADSFLMAEIRFLAVFIFVFCWLLMAAIGSLAAGTFVLGCSASILAGYLGMKVATYTNVRCTHECWRSLTNGYEVAIRGGCVASFLLMSIAVCSLFAVAFSYSKAGRKPGSSEMWLAISGYSFGVSSIGLFARVGGGVYTKAADIGADLSGKVDFGLSEDDYRNPACIADNVGDNVGGVVGMGSDLFASLSGAACAAIALAECSSLQLKDCGREDQGIGQDWRARSLPLLIPASSILSGILALAASSWRYRVQEVRDVEFALKGLLKASAVIQTPVLYGLAWWCLPPSFAMSCSQQFVTPLHCSIAMWIGLWCGLVIAYSAEYYTSDQHTPVQEIATSQQVSASSGVILGLAVGYSSCTVPVVCLAFTVLVSMTLVGPFGVALAALGMLSVMPLSLAVEAYDSIADNAGGIAEMAGLTAEGGADVREITDVLGGAGSVGNGFAMGAASLVTFSLLQAFNLRANIQPFDASDRWYFTGLMLGAMLPYAFSAITMKAVGRAADEMVAECRRQFPRIIQHQEQPDYNKCITISTKASLQEMMGPAGLLAIGAPVVSGLLFGKRCTAGVLQGLLISGMQMAISMINTGGAWDNAKKLATAQGLKDSEQHRNAVIGDTVGDPLKDVSGPSLNVLITLAASTSLLFGVVISNWSAADGQPFWAETWR